MKVILPVAGKGEFQLTDALQMMIEQGGKFQIWAARHNSAVALYVVGPFRRQGDAHPSQPTRSLLRNMGEGNTAKVCAPRGHDRCRKLVTVTPLLKATYAQEDKEAALKKFIDVEQKLRDCIRTNNILEQLNRKIRRRTRVVGCFAETSPVRI